MEHGFFHPDLGYWQTNTTPSQDILDTYPQGTVEVPLKPSAYTEWNGSAWIDVPPPAPTADEVRAERDRLLAATDWMALSDVNMSPEWIAYRQALRDLPQQEGFPSNVVWPTKPEV